VRNSGQDHNILESKHICHLGCCQVFVDNCFNSTSQTLTVADDRDTSTSACNNYGATT
jgi:hypothetical protein